MKAQLNKFPIFTTMENAITQYIAAQESSRQALLTKMHAVIVKGDESVTADVEPMMGKDMILYKQKCVMKYGLASVKKHLTLHVLPMYGSKLIFDRYQSLLPKAVFQKGCINFNSQEEFPITILQQLIKDCAPIDLAVLLEEMRSSRKKSC